MERLRTAAPTLPKSKRVSPSPTLGSSADDHSDDRFHTLTNSIAELVLPLPSSQ